MKIHCPECKEIISDHNWTCPGCHTPIRRRTMELHAKAVIFGYLPPLVLIPFVRWFGLWAHWEGWGIVLDMIYLPTILFIITFLAFVEPLMNWVVTLHRCRIREDSQAETPA